MYIQKTFIEKLQLYFPQILKKKLNLYLVFLCLQ